jgi:hypothetical protein
MANKENAFVVVDRSWFDGAMDALTRCGSGDPTVQTHIIVAPLDDRLTIAVCGCGVSRAIGLTERMMVPLSKCDS